MSPLSRHQGLAEISQKLLENARVSAKANNDYDSKTTRDELTAIYKTISGHETQDWQLKVAEALVLGLDCVAIAGTGSGKTVPFTIPLLLPRYKDKIAYIISPLKTLKEEQSNRFKEVGI